MKYVNYALDYVSNNYPNYYRVGYHGYSGGFYVNLTLNGKILTLLFVFTHYIHPADKWSVQVFELQPELTWEQDIDSEYL